MGTFHTKCLIENHIDRKKSIVIPKLLVDTGSEYSWIPESSLEKIAVAREKKDLVFVMANGQHRTRPKKISWSRPIAGCLELT